MKTVRSLFMLTATVYLASGYAASQYALFTGVGRQYAAAVDSPQMKLLSAVLLLGAIALAFVPDREPNGSDT